MKDFLIKHKNKITGYISTFDRIIFKGYLPFSYPRAAEGFLNNNNILLKNYRSVVKANSERIKRFGLDFAEQNQRPYIYLKTRIRKEEYVKEIIKKDGISEGLICVLACVEENPSFSMRYGEGKPVLVSSRPKCLTLYFYFMDPTFGLMHIRLMTWMPYMIQIGMNGHEWLARALDKKGIGYQKVENAFISIEDIGKAQKISNSFTRMNWPRILQKYAKTVNPLLKNLLKGMEYYWVIDQSEYATDIFFPNGKTLSPLYRKLEQHAAICLRAEDIMTYLGRKLNGNFKGEIGNHLKKRWPGSRVKHRMKNNWIKMYDKHGCILRVETVINRPYEFKIRRIGKRNGELVTGWYPMAKRVSNMYRYAEVSMSANSRYLNALSVVEDPSETYQEITKICEPAVLNGRRRRGLNPLRKQDYDLCCAVFRGENFIHGFSHSDFARQLEICYSKDKIQRRRESARTSRLLQLLRAHQLIRKISRTRKYQITKNGTRLISSLIFLKENDLPKLNAA